MRQEMQGIQGQHPKGFPQKENIVSQRGLVTITNYFNMNQITLLQRDIALLKQQQAESLRLLKACKGQVGMMLGEEIESHVAELTGAHFNAKEWILVLRNALH
jgi:hypothetical protein